MDFKEIFKNPAKFIFSFLEKKNNNNAIPDGLNYESNPANSINQSAKKIDWLWIFRGKTGLFLKIATPTIIVLSLIQPFVSKNNSPSIAPPPKSDTGDLLKTPDFVSSEYTSVALGNGKFLLYTPKSNQIHSVGNRGVVLDTKESLLKEILLPLAINPNSYIYLENAELKLFVSKMVYDEESHADLLVEDLYTLSKGINSKDEILNLHLTSDNKVTYSRNNEFFVYNLQGELVHALKVSEGYAYTYFEDSTFYIKPDGDSYSLIRLNSSDQEVYSQNLSTLKPHSIYIVNNDRFLVVYESPTESSFFLVEMRDSGTRTIFKFIPNEKETKLTKVERVLFNPDDNTVLLQGSKLAKLFNISGNQLWVR